MGKIESPFYQRRSENKIKLDRRQKTKNIERLNK